MKAKALSNVARRRAEMRQTILEQSTILFGEHGYEGVALRDIAKASGIQLSKLSSHFARKEDLREAAIQHAIDALVEHNSSLDNSSASPREGLRKFVINSVALLMSDRPEVKLLDREFYGRLQDPETIAMAVRTLERPFVEIGNQNIANLIKNTGTDLLDEISPIRLTQILFAIAYGMTKLSRTHHYLVGPAPLTPDIMAEHIILIFERTLGIVPAHAGKSPRRKAKAATKPAAGEGDRG